MIKDDTTFFVYIRSPLYDEIPSCFHILSHFRVPLLMEQLDRQWNMTCRNLIFFHFLSFWETAVPSEMTTTTQLSTFGLVRDAPVRICRKNVLPNQTVENVRFANRTACDVSFSYRTAFQHKLFALTLVQQGTA